MSSRTHTWAQYGEDPSDHECLACGTTTYQHDDEAVWFSACHPPTLSPTPEARWELVDAHRCTACGYLDTDGYRMIDHLRTHRGPSPSDDTQPAKIAEVSSDASRQTPDTPVPRP